jgi:hypothetical protein
VQYGVENRGREEKETEMRGGGLQGWRHGGGGWLRFWGAGARGCARRLPEDEEGQLEVGYDRWGPPVCEKEGKAAGLGWFPMLG